MIRNNEESIAAQFARYQESPTGRMRYALAKKNMEMLHSLSQPLQVLDAAGGNGINTEWLASQGHSVTLYDSDPEMLQQAQCNLRARGFLDRCRCVQGGIENLATAFPEASFDLVLFHHIVEYLEDPLRAFRDLITLTARGGELSLITLNPVSEVIRAIVFRKDADLANSKLADLGYDAKWFGRARLYSLEQILRWANLSGWALGDFRGIRVLADYIPEVEYTEGKEQQATHLEEKLAGMEPYRRIGRYLQFCFKK